MADAGAEDAAILILVPLPDDPPSPDATAAEPTDAGARRAVAATAPGFGYTDSDDLPVDAGDDGRCPAATTATTSKPREVVVRIEHVRQPKPSLDLVIAALGVRKRLWPSFPNNLNPNSCSTELRPDALAFQCSEVMTGTTGKVYARGSDVVLGYDTTDGRKLTRYHLPCGSIARFERSPCPARCFVVVDDRCECTELGDAPPRPPSPIATTSPR